MKCVLHILLMFCLLISFNLTAQSKTIKSESHETFKLKIGNCFTSNDDIAICFDDIMEDSRCPIGVQCVKAGNAKLNLSLRLDDSSVHVFELNTYYPRFPNDAIIENLYILLEGLTQTGKSPQEARLLIANLEQQESNAQLLDFNDESGKCHYGWAIKIGADTIKSNDHKLRRKYQKSMDYPVAVYLELGGLLYNCSEYDSYNLYAIKRVVKIIDNITSP